MTQHIKTIILALLPIICPVFSTDASAVCYSDTVAVWNRLIIFDKIPEEMDIGITPHKAAPLGICVYDPVNANVKIIMIFFSETTAILEFSPDLKGNITDVNKIERGDFKLIELSGNGYWSALLKSKDGFIRAIASSIPIEKSDQIREIMMNIRVEKDTIGYKNTIGGHKTKFKVEIMK